MKLIDTHCHLDNADFDGDRAEVIARALAAGVETMVAIGSGDGPPDLEAGVRLAEQHDFIYSTVGVHPHEARKADAETYLQLERLAAHPRVVAIGEIGLDYHYDFSPRETQREVFERQLAIAAAARKPIVIHTREAWPDTIAVLKQNYSGGGIFHCFSGSPEQAEEVLALGFHLSFSGIVTFPKATAIQQAARLAPPDRILVETDAPYLAPVPHRGKRNEPAFVAHTAAKLAELRGVPVDEIAALTSANWRRLCLQAAPVER